MIETMIAGGPMMLFLLACSITALAVILDRAKAYMDSGKVDNRALRADVLKLLAENRLQDALTLCTSTPGPTSAVLLVGLQSYEKLLSVKASSEAIRMIVSKAMEDYYPHALNTVEKRLNILSTIGTAAPLFGMTGTVTGMIKSFSALAASGMDAKIVGAGIAEALITTATGLLIALGAVIPYNLFMARVEKIGLEMEEAAAEMVDFITMQAARQASK